MRMALMTIACGAGLFAVGAADAAKRVLDVGDFDRLLSVESVACSREGTWIAYTVEGSDSESDERKSAVWVTDFQGTTQLRLTAAGQQSASDPKFSPDGRYVAFLSARKAEGKPQLYLLDRRGGEAQLLEGIAGDVAEYDWSPDGAQLVISMSAGATEAKTPPPIVIDRLHFKEDGEGYLTAADRKQLYLFDLATKTLTPLTRESDDTAPVYSPDGRHIAFFSNRSGDQTGKLDL